VKKETFGLFFIFVNCVLSPYYSGKVLKKDEKIYGTGVTVGQAFDTEGSLYPYFYPSLIFAREGHGNGWDSGLHIGFLQVRADVRKEILPENRNTPSVAGVVLVQGGIVYPSLFNLFLGPGLHLYRKGLSMGAEYMFGIEKGEDIYGDRVFEKFHILSVFLGYAMESDEFGVYPSFGITIYSPFLSEKDKILMIFMSFGIVKK